MTVTWLGQGGLYFDFDGVKVIIDPYLSNSVYKIQPQNNRRVEVDERFLKIKPDKQETRQAISYSIND